MAASKSNLQFVLTSNTIGSQSDPSCSTGGYASTTAMPSNFFNNSYNGNLKQYRCIAVVNASDTDLFKNVSFFFKQQSINPFVSFKMAIERPKDPALNGTAYVQSNQTPSVISVVDPTSFINYGDDYFDGCVLQFTSGSNINFQSIISSFDGDTGTFTLTTAVPLAIDTGDTFRVWPAPSQIVPSGTIEPQFNTNLVSALSVATSTSMVSAGNIPPRSVVYLWFEKSTSLNAPPFDDNSMTFTVNYQT
jgi:hypothetical protein